jgi:CubicO group peptidase (beta-lactamase class C family)
MDSQRLAEMLESIEQQDLTLDSVLVIRHGYIVAEVYFLPFRQDTKHELHSCTKSFASALVGIAIDRGTIDGVNHPVLDFFPERTFADTDARKRAMTLEDLLTMTSGLDWEEGDPIYAQMMRSPDWVQFVLDTPMAVEPGSQFNYCSGCSHILSAIVQATAGTSTLDFARTYLFEPLGISDVTWYSDPQGIANGGWGLRITPRDMAKLGYLYLNGGVWDGQQVVSAEWVATSVEAHVETGEELDYGYQWWVYPPLNAYTARGRGGQLIFVMPDLDVVAVFTAEIEDDQPLLALIEDFIVRAVQSSEALPENPQGVARLQSLIEAAGKP